MRNPAELHTGDDWTPQVTLTENNGSAYAVPSGATVRAAITDQDGLNILAGPVTVLEATSGSDWPNGVIVPIFPAAQTVNLPTGYARIEVEVLHDGNVSTWSLSRTPRIEPGVITNLTLEPAPGETLSDINAAELGSGAATDGHVLTADGAGGADWEAIPAAGGGLTAADIDTLAELNAIVADATLIDTADSRLSDARTPTAHAASHATGGGDALTPANIGAATAAQGTLADSAQQPPAEGAFVDGDKTKLDGIEALADVTDAANVTAAGALMDSEVTNLAAVKAFDAADYATAAQGATADTATQPGDDADTLGSGAATDGQVLTADGLGGAAWEDAAGGGGSAAGSDGQIQFALSGGFSADAGLAYNSTTKALTVGGATVTTDSPVLNLAQTWNAAGVAFTALKLNVTNTASAASSLLMDLQVGLVSQEKTDKAGNKTLTGIIKTADGANNANAYGFSGSTSLGFSRLGSYLTIQASGGGVWTAALRQIDGIGLQIYSTMCIGWAPGNPTDAFSDLRLYRDAAGTLAQRNGTSPQTFRLANTWTNASNLEQLSIGWAANVCTIATEALGTGTKRNLVLDGANRAAYSETAADIAAALVAHGIMSPA